MSTMKNCRLCFNECDEEGGLGYNSKLSDLCCKYLHSSLTQEVSSQSYDQPFCPKCYVSAMELIVLSEQLEFIQKSVSELVFVFSMEILHRRTQIADFEKQGATTKRLVEFDVSALPNTESWSTNNIPTQIYESPMSTAKNSQEIITENIYVNNVEDLIPYDNQIIDEALIDEALIDEIKCENNVEVWIEEDVTSIDFGPLLTDTFTDSNTELPSGKAFEGSCLSNAPKVESHLPTPVLQLPKLKLHRGGQEIVVEKDLDYFMFKQSQMGGIGKTIWTKSDCGTSYKIAKHNPTSSNNQCARNVQQQSQSLLSTEPGFVNQEVAAAAEPLSSVSTEIISVNQEVSAEHPKKRRQKSVKPSPGDQSKEKPYKCSFCKKRFKFQARMITHKMGHIGEKPYQCFLCPKSFLQPNSLSYHQQLHHSKERSPTQPNSLSCQQQLHHPKERSLPHRCTYCSKEFPSNFAIKRHIMIHTGEKPFRCDQCNYAASQSHNLRLHKIRVHSDNIA